MTLPYKPKLKVIPYEKDYALQNVRTGNVLFMGPKERMQKYKRELLANWDKPMPMPKLSESIKKLIRERLKGLL